MTGFSLRQAGKDDLALTYSITEDAMRPYVEATWGKWDEEDQLEKHRANYTPETCRIVVQDGRPVGLLAVEQEPEFLWLVKLYLLSAARNRGLGSSLLAQVVHEATAVAKPIRLRVLRANTAAQRFYLRHGFKVVGEEPERLFMVRPLGEA
ncbi:MAG: GNAT family N-acetyltransferase [bacterium]